MRRVPPRRAGRHKDFTLSSRGERKEARRGDAEFVDDRNVEWRAWDITPESMHPVTAREED